MTQAITRAAQAHATDAPVERTGKRIKAAARLASHQAEIAAEEGMHPRDARVIYQNAWADHMKQRVAQIDEDNQTAIQAAEQML